MSKPADPQAEAHHPAAPTAKVEVQNAAQWLARMTLSFDSRVDWRDGFGLRWRDATQTIQTPELVPGVCLQLTLSNLNFQFVERGNLSPHALDIDGKSSAEIEAWLLVEMLHRGFERERFSKELPYKPLALMSGDEPKYETEMHAPDLAEIAERIARAAKTLHRARATLGVPDADANLTVWPDRFKIGFLTGNDDKASASPVVKVAFSLDGDSAADASTYVVSRLADQIAQDVAKRDLAAEPGESEDTTIERLAALVRQVQATAVH